MTAAPAVTPTPKEWLATHPISPWEVWTYQCGCGACWSVKELAELRCPDCGQQFTDMTVP